MQAVTISSLGLVFGIMLIPVSISVQEFAMVLQEFVTDYLNAPNFVTRRILLLIEIVITTIRLLSYIRKKRSLRIYAIIF